MNIKSTVSIMVLCAFSLSVQGEVKPNALFCDNAVLQRDTPVPVWGSAAPTEKVTVEFASQKKTITADAQGKWKVTLDPMPVSAKPETLKIIGDLKSEMTNLSFTNVLVGEVWICSGQSNMAFRKGKLKGDGAQENYPKLRLFTVSQKTSLKPETELGGNWSESSEEAASSFSAVGYYFGRDVLKATGIPIGMIHSAVGGTPAQAWTSLSGLEKDPSLLIYSKPIRDLLANENAPGVAKALGKRGATVLYNGMIAPLIPYAIRGVIWYQGESNNGKPFEYRTLFPRMIADWREKWGRGDFPFFFVQICPYQAMTPELREAQFLTWKHTPHTAMAVTVDVGEAGNIHPVKKAPVGARLALAARALVYGEKMEYSGPEYDSLKIDHGKAILSFKHVGNGLVAKDGPLKGFTVAGADKKFIDAKAEIAGDTVVVTGDQVAAPVAVRYGWVNVPDVNLWNKEGLPASPFRTDPESMTMDTPSAKQKKAPVAAKIEASRDE